MHVINSNTVAKESITTPLFTDPDVTIQRLLPDSREFDVNVVNFGKGVRNKFHTHDHEQVLIVTTGKGIIATEDKEIVITPRDVVLISAGEKHWHGATEDSEFSHIYVSNPSSQLTQIEK